VSNAQNYIRQIGLFNLQQ